MNSDLYLVTCPCCDFLITCMNEYKNKSCLGKFVQENNTPNVNKRLDFVHE